jgi:hypothetical protein
MPDQPRDDGARTAELRAADSGGQASESAYQADRVGTTIVSYGLDGCSVRNRLSKSVRPGIDVTE